MIRLILLCFLSMPFFFVQAQLKMNFALDTSATSSLELNALKFYIGNIYLLQDSTVVFAGDSIYSLIDFDQANSLSLHKNLPNDLDYNILAFTLGVDSITNQSGAFGGGLDPTKGMYWTWQSGYINFKLEGNYLNKGFEFHLGGFLGENNSEQHLQFDVEKGADVNLKLVLKDFFNHLDPDDDMQIMSPSLRAVELMEMLGESFIVSE